MPEPHLSKLLPGSANAGSRSLSRCACCTKRPPECQRGRFATAEAAYLIDRFRLAKSCFANHCLSNTILAARAAGAEMGSVQILDGAGFEKVAESLPGFFAAVATNP